MIPCQAHLLSVLRTSRDELVRRSTDVVYLTDNAPLPREDVEQLMRASLAILEEGLAGETNEVRSGFLEALPELAGATTLDDAIKGGLPTWGVIIGQLSVAVNEQYRDEAIMILSRFMGLWWSDVLKVMLPVYMAKGTL